MRTGLMEVRISVPKWLTNFIGKLWNGMDNSPVPINVNKITTLMKTLRTSDKHLVSKFLNMTSMQDHEAKEHFYKAISLPLQGVCSVLKRFGGTWKKGTSAKAVDGDKFICMDAFTSTEPCLSYSFGIG